MTAKLMLVLHSHLPYVKRQGRWPFGEVWLYEAMAETYIPFLRTASRLYDEGAAVSMALSLSPTLVQQVASPYINDGFIEYLKNQEDLAAGDERYFMARGQKDFAQVANQYRRYYQDIRRDFLVEYDGDLIGGVSNLVARMNLEIMTTAATHAYLPLIQDRSSLERQIRVGKEVFTNNFGIEPRGFWLPECGYYQGLEDILIENGMKYFIVDGHAVEGGKPPQVYSDMDGLEVEEVEVFAETGLSTYRPYKIKDKPIAVFGRNTMVSYQVWSKDYGYPGDVSYREFHKESPRSGLKYWKVTDRNRATGKMPYNHDEAIGVAKSHAAHFVDVIHNVGQEAAKMGFREPLIVACYDTELFGHWWWEGVDWIEEVMRLVSRRDDIKMVTPSHMLRDWDKLAEAQVFESSWGVGGKHFGWYNLETSWMWDTISKARDEFNAIAGVNGGDILQQAIVQAEKELMLMESSDWFFMVTNNHTRDYAVKRFFNHYAKLIRLVEMIKSDRFDAQSVQWLRSVQKEDELFT